MRSFVNQQLHSFDSFDVVALCIVTFIALVGLNKLVGLLSADKLAKASLGVARRSAKVQAEQEKAIEFVSKELYRDDPDGVGSFAAIPARGLAHDDVLRQMRALRDRDEQYWAHGRVSGCVYWGNKEHEQFLVRAQEIFFMSNALHPDVFPAVTKFEREVVSMTKSMLGAADDEQVSGAVTSGGTESILMAMRAYAEHGKTARGIAKPQVVLCVTAHAAFDKAAQYFGIELVKVPAIAATQAMDVAAARRAITRNTVALVGSAVQYPHGTIDPIEELAALALERGVGLHVDGCLGGYILPWLVKLGVDFGTRFDFSVPGVTSMSCDTHKYAYTSKGTSVVLFRGRELKHGMYFIYAHWPGGIYASPTIAGSKPGAVSAGAWASILALGEDGFLKLARGIRDTFDAIKAAVVSGAAGELRLIGDPRAMVVSFDSAQFDIQQWATGMTERGWNLNRLQKPSAVHVCVTAALIGQAPAFIRDSKAVSDAIVANPELHAGGAAKVYGMAASLPDSLRGALVEDMVMGYLDAKTM